MLSGTHRPVSVFFFFLAGVWTLVPLLLSLTAALLLKGNRGFAAGLLIIAIWTVWGYSAESAGPDRLIVIKDVTLPDGSVVKIGTEGSGTAYENGHATIKIDGRIFKTELPIWSVARKSSLEGMRAIGGWKPR